MYIIQVHSLEVPEPYYTAGTSSSSSAAVGLNPSVVTTLRCCVRLLRNLSGGPLSSPASRSTTLFVAAVPSYLSFDDFILFCEGNICDFIELCFFRNDGMEDRYSVLITLANRLSADGFYCSHNGKRFRPPEVEVCHMYFVQSYKCFAYVEEANAVPPGYVELPTCPVCLERLDHDTSGIQITQCDHSFQCPCVLKWANLSCQVCRLFQQQDEKPSCAMCGTFENLWACMICDFIGCGRYEGGHAIRHWEDTQHCYSLELEKQQVWDYISDSYVHRLHQSKVDGKSVMKNSSCMSHKDKCGTCGYGEDSSFGEAILNKKVEVNTDEYNHRLASNLEAKRQHYELLLVEAKSRKESIVSEKIEKALSLKIEDLRSKLEQCSNEKTAVENKNKELTQKQENLKMKVKEIEERELASLTLKDQQIFDLEEQIRDMTVYMESQKKVSAMANSDDIKGGTVLPVEYGSSPSATSKKRTKSSRKRN